MVEYALRLDGIFGSLSDATRRDILRRLVTEELSVGEVAANYKHLTLAAVSKHLKVLEKAGLIARRRKGKKYMLKTNTEVLLDAQIYLRQYEQFWQQRLDALDNFLNGRLNSERSNYE